MANNGYTQWIREVFTNVVLELRKYIVSGKQSKPSEQLRMKNNKTCILLLLSLFTLLSCEQKHIRSTNFSYTKPIELSDSIKVDYLYNTGMDTTQIVNLTKLILSETFPNIHSLLILKDNKLVYENYFAGYDEIIGKKLGYVEHSVDDLHDCRSISKSVTSACIGIAVKKGLIANIDEPVFSYFKQYQDKFDVQKKKITIRHLLTMTSGLKWNEDISYRDPRNTELRMDMSSDPIGFILGRPMTSEPGSTWNYNGGNTQLLAAIIKSVSGLTLDKFAEQELFVPLGIEKYEWLPLIKNIPAAASGLRLRSRDLLKFGMLYMNGGRWQKKDLLNNDWVVESLNSVVERPSTKDKNAGYGFQFWTYTEKVNDKEIEIQEAKGNGGQRLFFCKSLNLLVLITAGNYNNWGIKNDSRTALVEYIIPQPATNIGF